MANEYYDATELPQAGTRSNAEQAARRFEAVEAGFDRLPAPQVLKAGRTVFGTDESTSAAAVALVFPAPLKPAPAAYDEGTTVSWRWPDTKAVGTGTGLTMSLHGGPARPLRHISDPDAHLDQDFFAPGSHYSAIYEEPQGRFLCFRAGAPEAVHPVGNTSAYAFYIAPALDEPGQITSATEIPTSGDGYRWTVLDEEEIEGPIYEGIPFITAWYGDLEVEVSANSRLELTLLTVHELSGGRKFTHSRTHIQDMPQGQRQSIPMAVFNSESRLRTGEYSIGGGTVTLTHEDFTRPVKLSYIFDVKTFIRGDTQGIRQAANLTFACFHNLQTTSHQLRRVVVPYGGPDAIDERVATWARAHSPSGTIPDNRIPSRIARDSEVPQHFTDLTGKLPDSALPNDVARDADIPTQYSDLAGRVPHAALPDGVSTQPLYLDGGSLPWSGSRVYEPRAVVTHDDATYLCIASTSGHARSVTEPGAGSAWETYWERIGFATQAAPADDGGDDGGTSLTDAEIGDKAFKNPPSLSDPQKAAVRGAVDAAEAKTDAEIGDAAFSNPPSDLSDAEKGAVRTAVEAASADLAGDVTSLAGRLAGLAALTADIQAAPAGTGWATALSSQGAIAVVDNIPRSEADLRAASGWRQVLTGDDFEGKFIVARLRRGDEPRQAEAQFTSLTGTVAPLGVNSFGVRGTSADNAWDLYGYDNYALGSADRRIELRVTSSAAHVGGTKFGGELTGGIAAGLVEPAALDAGSDAKKEAFRTAIGAGVPLTAEGVLDLADSSRATGDRGKLLAVASGDEDALALVDAPSSSGTSLTDSQIGDKAFSNPPSDLSDNEKDAVRSAIEAEHHDEVDITLSAATMTGSTLGTTNLAAPDGADKGSLHVTLRHTNRPKSASDGVDYELLVDIPTRRLKSIPVNSTPNYGAGSSGTARLFIADSFNIESFDYTNSSTLDRQIGVLIAHTAADTYQIRRVHQNHIIKEAWWEVYR